jgi:pyruvate formate lyase activating enzyme
VQRVEILPFHKLGAFKYEALEVRFPLDDPPYLTAAQIADVRERMRAGGLPI